ncbi:MAG: ATP-binding protein [Chlamydiia bacterium]
MLRDIDRFLDEWRTSPHRSPLVVRGARQVGKSYSIQAFGERCFEHTAIVNFERHPAACQCFAVRDPQEILRELELVVRKPIVPGKTLLFLDEIQECPEALVALRYFKEEMPGLHVIAAGSLLEFVLNDNLSFPVGRVQFLTMRPLSLMEFLSVRGETMLRERVEGCSLADKTPPIMHQRLLEELRLYILVGGMPAAVEVFIETGSILQTQQKHHDLLLTYRNDFGKYASAAQAAHLQRLLSVAPGFVGQHVRYSKIDPEAPNPAREYKIAIRLLSQAGLLSQVYTTNASGIPLSVGINEKKFKLVLLDIGLLQAAMGLSEPLLLENGLLAHRGALAEQLVGQELLAYADPRRASELFFWCQEKKGSAAEVDYVVQLGSSIIPIEVKAGTTGGMRSLRQFMEQKSSPFGVKVSEEPLAWDRQVLKLPAYLLSQLRRLSATIPSQKPPEDRPLA